VRAGVIGALGNARPGDYRERGMRRSRDGAGMTMLCAGRRGRTPS